MTTQNVKNNNASISPDTPKGVAYDNEINCHCVLDAESIRKYCRLDSRFRGNDREKELSPSDTLSLSSSCLTRGSIGQSNHYYGFSGRTPDGVCRRMTEKSELSSSCLTRGSINNEFNTMSKALGFITALCMTLMVSAPALADDTTTETCANGAGKVVYGVVDNEKYCVGTGNLNWWNTYAWCDAQGMTLPDIARDCRCSEVMSDCSAGYCPNFGSRFTEGYMYFANTDNDGKAYHAQISASISLPYLGLKERSNTYRMVAICKM